MCCTIRRENGCAPDRLSRVLHPHVVGDSAIVNPDGEFVAGPVRMKEEILYAEIDPKQMRGAKWMLDVAGHYGRPDVFELIVHREPRRMIATRETEPPSLRLS